MKDKLIKKQLGVSVKQTVVSILEDGYNPYSVHPSRVEEWRTEQALMFIAEQLDTLGAIVKAYKTGKL